MPSGMYKRTKHMKNFNDLTGRKFGRLTAIKRNGLNKFRQILWLCKCECGKNKDILAQHLLIGATKSCGCLSKEAPNNKMRLSLGLSNMRNLITAYKYGAKKRGLEYKLTEEQFFEITQKDCYYCGKKPSNIYNRKECNGAYTYNGIDRVDNNKGYTIKNSVPCCHTCNGAKGKLTFQEFEDWIKRIYSNICRVS